MSDAVTKPKSNLICIKEFFGMSATQTMAESKRLSDVDKEQLGAGIRDGSLNYEVSA